ncbi:MAG: tetratricopeptide repeat protein, partial [Chloroflexia bacterium]|nr:tetratricopeptide repeat protein [Chloroflexia bacterium]
MTSDGSSRSIAGDDRTDPPTASHHPQPATRNPPAGLVAFLFTDIEGSTRLWERDPAAMRRALDRHNALLGAAIAAARGVHFKTIGDAVQAAFPDASSAMAAAAEAQRALTAEPWPETGPIRVRMAIHVGEAAPTGIDRPDYLAPALNRLARLLAAGYGGQTLLTDTARSLAAGTLPADASLRDLGRHRLRDLLEAEQVWQLTLHGLPDTFPPLKTLERQPTNLPSQPTALVGRDALLVALGPIVTDPATRLLTLTGPGGVGKTRLALQLAADALDAFPDGAFFVDLASLTDAAAVPAAIAAAIGVHEGGGLSLEEALTAHLAPKRQVLLLDNLEQIRPVAALGKAVAGLLAAAPALTILATSRAPLRIRAEREWPVEPLAVPDPDLARLLPPAALAENPAVALFLERARAAKPTFDLTDANAAAVAAIVHRLDGLPLALELAAARLRALSPSQLRDRLGKQLDLLFGPSGDRPDRQQTLRAAIRWSHDLLSPEQKALFRRLGVFAGGFSLEAAEAVTAELGEPWLDALDGVDELLAESLLRTEETPAGELRYRMLETIRAYAVERLEESGEEAAARAAHFDHFNDWAHEADLGIDGPDQVAWLERFATDHDNALAALDWAVADGPPGAGVRIASWLCGFWQGRGHFSEGRRRLAAAIAADTGGPTRHRATSLDGAGTLAWRQGDLSAAAPFFNEALAIWRALGDRTGESKTLNNLGNVADFRGDLDRAATLFGESLAIARDLDLKPQVAIGLNNLALVHLNRGDLDTAQAMLEESLAIKRTLADRSALTSPLTNLAIIAVDRGDLDRAVALLEECLAIDRDLGDTAGVADDLGNLASIADAREDSIAAAHLHREALALRRQLGDWLSIAYSLETIAGSAAASLGESAARLYG